MIIQILRFITCLIYAVIHVILISNVGDKKDLRPLTLKKWTVACIVSGTFIIFENYFAIPSIKIILITISIFILLQYLYVKNYFKCFIRFIVIIAVVSLAEALSSFIFVFILKFKIQFIMQHYYYYILYNLLNITFITCFICLARMKSIIITMNKNISKKTKSLLLCIIFLQMIKIGVEFFIAYYITLIPHLQFISIISYICSISSIGLLLYATNIIIDKENILKLSDEYNQNLQIYNSVLQESIENQRKIAHEHGNQLTVLSGYISNNDLEKAKKYVSKIIGQLDQVDSGMLSNIKDSGLKALIVFKVALIENKNIELELVIDDEIEDTIIANEDMCNIMGVLLDNAIDASINTSEPFISLTIIKNDDGLVVNIMNSIEENNIDTEMIFKKGYSTKGEGRGFGLSIVYEIIQKYKELELLTRVEDKLFIQELSINKNVSSLVIE